MFPTYFIVLTSGVSPLMVGIVPRSCADRIRTCIEGNIPLLYPLSYRTPTPLPVPGASGMNKRET